MYRINGEDKVIKILSPHHGSLETDLNPIDVRFFYSNYFVLCLTYYVIMLDNFLRSPNLNQDQTFFHLG